MTPKQLAKIFVNEVKSYSISVAEFAAPYLTVIEEVLAIETEKATTADYEKMREAANRLRWATDRTGLISHSPAIRDLIGRAKQWSREKLAIVVVTDEFIQLLSRGIAALYTGEEGRDDSIYLADKIHLPFPISHCGISTRGAAGRPVIWFETHYDITSGNHGSAQFAYTLSDVEALREALVKAGAGIRESWNGAGAGTVSFGLMEPAKVVKVKAPEGWQ